MSPSGIDLAGFPEGSRARPLDHRKSLIRSTCWNSVRQSSYLPSALKIVLELLTIFSVLQLVLLYYPRSTVPRCTINFVRFFLASWLHPLKQSDCRSVQHIREYTVEGTGSSTDSHTSCPASHTLPTQAMERSTFFLG